MYVFSEKIEALKTSVFLDIKCLKSLKENPLKGSNKRTHISLVINLFVSLIEVEHQLKLSNKRSHM